MKKIFKKLGVFLDATLLFTKRAFVFIILLLIVVGIFSGGGSNDDISKIPENAILNVNIQGCLLYTSPSPRDGLLSRMPSSA